MAATIAKQSSPARPVPATGRVPVAVRPPTGGVPSGSCRSPAVRGKPVCRMHGAAGGAPTGTCPGREDGHYSADAIRERRALAELLRGCRVVGGEALISAYRVTGCASAIAATMIRMPQIASAIEYRPAEA